MGLSSPLASTLPSVRSRIFGSSGGKVHWAMLRRGLHGWRREFQGARSQGAGARARRVRLRCGLHGLKREVALGSRAVSVRLRVVSVRYMELRPPYAGRRSSFHRMLRGPHLPSQSRMLFGPLLFANAPLHASLHACVPTCLHPTCLHPYVHGRKREVASG